MIDLDAAGHRYFEVWIHGAEFVRGLIRSDRMFDARIRFLTGIRSVAPGVVLNRIRARQVPEAEARELYPAAFTGDAPAPAPPGEPAPSSDP